MCKKIELNWLTIGSNGRFQDQITPTVKGSQSVSTAEVTYSSVTRPKDDYAR